MTLFYRVCVLIAASVSLTGVQAAKIASSPVSPVYEQASSAVDKPDERISRLAKDLLTHIAADKKAQKGDVEVLKKLVDEKVMPFVMIEKMTAAAVGPAWRSATPEQRRVLQEEFKILLLRTYSGALTQAGGAKVEVKPLKPDEIQAATGAIPLIVRSQVKTAAGNVINLDYRMQSDNKTQPQAWKIIDVNVGGIWLTQNYRSQFAEEINAKGTDGLIKTLQTKNQSKTP
jgi:phospholipid transport system substrate-binding protein